ncbi:MAG TPA: hypothetical protein PKD18_09320 [Saprospiraceae bacterium]|nr:hypothetical protein [Saprospiraceae bacterium]
MKEPQPTDCGGDSGFRKVECISKVPLNVTKWGLRIEFIGLWR